MCQIFQSDVSVRDLVDPKDIENVVLTVWLASMHECVLMIPKDVVVHEKIDTENDLDGQILYNVPLIAQWARTGCRAIETPCCADCALSQSSGTIDKHDSCLSIGVNL